MNTEDTNGQYVYMIRTISARTISSDKIYYNFSQENPKIANI